MQAAREDDRDADGADASEATQVEVGGHGEASLFNQNRSRCKRGAPPRRAHVAAGARETLEGCPALPLGHDGASSRWWRRGIALGVLTAPSLAGSAVGPMAAKKKGTALTDRPLRGVPLVKKAIELAKRDDAVDPEPLPAALLKRLKLPNGEPLSPAMRTLLAFDGSWLGLEFDAEEGGIESLPLEELIEQEFGERAIPLFSEAYDILGEDCVVLGDGGGARRFLYVGTRDSFGEYPVLTVDADDRPRVGGFIPFDVWVAQEFGALPEDKDPSWVPEEYAPFQKELATLNGDGRVSFHPEGSDALEDEDGYGNDDEAGDDFDEEADDLVAGRDDD